MSTKGFQKVIKVHLKNGETLSFDLLEEDQKRMWDENSQKISFQSQITGMGVLFNGQWFSLPLPKKFRQYHFKANLVESNKKDGPRFKGERVQCYADDILISLQVYWGLRPRMSRIDVIKVGKRRFNPELITG